MGNKDVERVRLWRISNPDKPNEYARRYSARNPDKRNELAKAYQRRKRATVEGKLLLLLRSRLSSVLGRRKTQKSQHTIELLGCSIAQLVQHLENKFKVGMTWDNQGLWHVDHIRPCASFDLTDPIQQRECFHYLNLQPLWAEDNMKKGAKYDGHKE